MPDLPSFTDEDINNIVAYLNTKKAPDPIKDRVDPNALKNPIPEPIPMSDLIVDLEVVTRIPASDKNNPLTRISKLDVQPETNDLFVPGSSRQALSPEGKSAGSPIWTWRSYDRSL